MTKVLDTVDASISTYVQDEWSIWYVLSNNLDWADYGGIDIKNDVLYIKAINQEAVQALSEDAGAYVQADPS